MGNISVPVTSAKRQFDGQEYVLTKINYTKEAAEDDQAYYQKRGNKPKILEEDGFWLLYTKVGQ
jgi:hypothetical protein